MESDGDHPVEQGVACETGAVDEHTPELVAHSLPSETVMVLSICEEQYLDTLVFIDLGPVYAFAVLEDS